MTSDPPMLQYSSFFNLYLKCVAQKGQPLSVISHPKARLWRVIDGVFA